MKKLIFFIIYLYKKGIGVSREFGPLEAPWNAGKGLRIFIIQIKMFLTSPRARVAELADALDLGSSPERGRGSNPLSRTKFISLRFTVNFKEAQK